MLNHKHIGHLDLERTDDIKSSSADFGNKTTYSRSQQHELTWKTESTAE